MAASADDALAIALAALALTYASQRECAITIPFRERPRLAFMAFEAVTDKRARCQERSDGFARVRCQFAGFPNKRAARGPWTCGMRNRVPWKELRIAQKENPGVRGHLV